jgi:hypothetical protein
MEEKFLETKESKETVKATGTEDPWEIQEATKVIKRLEDSRTNLLERLGRANTLNVHSSGVRSVCFSSDGNF